MGRKAVKMHTAASRARKRAQQSESVQLSDSESSADIGLSGSESPAAVEHSNVVNDDFAAIAATEVSHYQVCKKPTCKSAQAVASLCQFLAHKDSADDLKELPAVDEYDETQESDGELTTNTNAIPTGVMNVSTGKLAEKSKVAKGKQRAV